MEYRTRVEPDGVGHEKVEGWGADKDTGARPGVPMEWSPPHAVGSPIWREPEEQHTEPVPLVGPERSLTPVYSTANPPHGLSGALRRIAYRLPDYRARRWLLLLVADRIDVIEHNPRAAAKFFGYAAAVASGLMILRGMRRSSGRRTAHHR